MTPEEKQILIQDLCARLPYGVICKTSVGDYKLLGIDDKCTHIDTPVYDDGDGYFDLEYEEVKPYLRPMSSMTEEEKENYYNLCTKVWDVHIDDYWYYDNYKSYDWLNAHHFDYRGLIEKGLALEAPEGMYDFK